MGRAPSNDETRLANSSHPNTTGYQFRRYSSSRSAMSSRLSPPVCRYTAVISVSSAWSQSAAASAVAIWSSGMKSP
jgi:hypothetical protein